MNLLLRPGELLIPSGQIRAFPSPFPRRRKRRKPTDTDDDEIMVIIIAIDNGGQP